MKKGDIIQVYIEKGQYPNSGIGYVDGQRVVVEGCFEGQGVEAKVYKAGSRRMLAKTISVIKKADGEQDPFCPHYGLCGGCGFQILPYSKQLELKGKEVLNQLKQNQIQYDQFTGIEGSVKQLTYRNKMEYTFGDETIGGEISLGMHKKNQFMSIVTVDHCLLVPEVFNLILSETLLFCKEKGYAFYHKKSHKGLMRNLILRRGEKTGEILVNIVTSTQGAFDEEAYTERILSLFNPSEKDESGSLSTPSGKDDTPGSLSTPSKKDDASNVSVQPNGKIVGILHTSNDRLSDAVYPEAVKALWGRDYFFDEILGLSFRISPFSFFQTNTLTTEKLYAAALAFLGDAEGKTIFDLYSGTGTITQILALKAKEVIGIELVEEAVQTARENAERNRLGNCRFIAGDVFEALSGLDTEEDQGEGTIKLKPDVIVVDPPRAGILPKALEKILHLEAPQIIYISCNPKTMGANLAVMQENGYQVKAVKAFDQFPYTKHVETVCLLERKEGLARDKDER